MGKMQELSRQQKPANMRVPDGWVGGPNRWTREERDQWRAFCLDPKGGDPQAGAGSRGRPVSMPVNEGKWDRFARDPVGSLFNGKTKEQEEAEVDELYERMVARGLVVREA